MLLSMMRSACGSRQDDSISVRETKTCPTPHVLPSHNYGVRPIMLMRTDRLRDGGRPGLVLILTPNSPVERRNPGSGTAMQVIVQILDCCLLELGLLNEDIAR